MTTDWEVRVVLGHRLLQARKRQALTQADVAKRVGVQFQQIAKYEYGECNITVPRLLAMSAALGVPAGELLGGL